MAIDSLLKSATLTAIPTSWATYPCLIIKAYLPDGTGTAVAFSLRSKLITLSSIATDGKWTDVAQFRAS